MLKHNNAIANMKNPAIILFIQIHDDVLLFDEI
jgi:hypothetical protein